MLLSLMSSGAAQMLDSRDAFAMCQEYLRVTQITVSGTHSPPRNKLVLGDEMLGGLAVVAFDRWPRGIPGEHVTRTDGR